MIPKMKKKMGGDWLNIKPGINDYNSHKKNRPV